MIHNELIEIVITENQILFKAKHLLFFSRLLEGNYPDTSRLIPTESKTDVMLHTKEFLQAIDRASLFAREGKIMSSNFQHLKTELIEISSNTPEIGKVVEEIERQFH